MMLRSASRSEPCASGTTMLLRIQPSTPPKFVVIVPTVELTEPPRTEIVGLPFVSVVSSVSATSMYETLTQPDVS
jgi:hypothetical protein